MKEKRVTNMKEIPIDFKAIAKETGVRKGEIFHSATFNEWVVSGHPDIDLIIIEPPKWRGKLPICIINNCWCYESNTEELTRILRTSDIGVSKRRKP